MEGYVKGVLLGEGTFGKVHQFTQLSVRFLSAAVIDTSESLQAGSKAENFAHSICRRQP